MAQQPSSRSPAGTPRHKDIYAQCNRTIRFHACGHVFLSWYKCVDTHGPAREHARHIRWDGEYSGENCLDCQLCKAERIHKAFSEKLQTHPHDRTLQADLAEAGSQLERLQAQNRYLKFNESWKRLKIMTEETITEKALATVAWRPGDMVREGRQFKRRNTNLDDEEVDGVRFELRKTG